MGLIEMSLEQLQRHLSAAADKTSHGRTAWLDEDLFSTNFNGFQAGADSTLQDEDGQSAAQVIFQ